jgi:hypothetical protein
VILKYLMKQQVHAKKRQLQSNKMHWQWQI